MAGRKQRRTARHLADRVAKKRPQNSPWVGIFWLVNGALLIDKTPLSEAESYGNCLNHPRGHVEVWRQYQQGGKVPLDMEYEKEPRGRVMFYMLTESFTSLADACILKRKSLIAKIKKVLHLPKRIIVDADPHYKCFRCLWGKQTDKHEGWEP